MKESSISRRAALKGGAIAGAGALVSEMLAGHGAAAISTDPIALKKGGTVLFQGDSITDAGRNKRDGGANSSGAMGRGYAFLIGSYLLMKFPELGLKIYNRGISGNKVPDLDARWDKDCVGLKPDVLSILIGVNDIWHKLNGNYDGTVETYEKGFAALLERTKKALPDTRIIVCEPFVLRCGAVKDNWFPEFDQRKAAAKRVADAAGTLWVPFQDMFDAAVTESVKPEYWGRDGVHPSMAGHTLMAMEWIKTAFGD